MRPVLLALVLFASTPVDAAACHRYSVWRYPRAQSCPTVAGHRAREMARGPQAPSRRVALITPTVGGQTVSAIIFSPAAPTRDIALPSLARTDCVGGEADEATRARLLLRAALENANAR